jgi:hypothetical protein
MAAVENGKLMLENIWLNCSYCGQSWSGELAATMGDECLTYIISRFICNTKFTVLALGVKCHGIYLSNRTLEEKDKAANDVISAINKWCADSSPMPASIQFEEYKAHKILGSLALERDNPASAIEHFVKCKDLIQWCRLDQNDKAYELNRIQINIARASSLLPGAKKASVDDDVLILRNDATWEVVDQCISFISNPCNS